MNLSITSTTFLSCICLVAMLFAINRVNAQNLTLEGQTGGFITPTAYVVYSAEGKKLSHPAVGYHFVNTAAVIGNVQTFSITEGFANRAEVGYTRNVHTLGNSAAFSSLWDYSGMNVFHGKVVALKEGKWSELMPGIGVGFVVRTDDHFVSGALDKKIYGVDQAYRNYDVYIAGTKTWLKPPLPLLLNFGFKVTNASIFGLGGQSTRNSGRFFGGLGIPLPLGHGWAAVPSAGFAQQPPQVVNLSRILVSSGKRCAYTDDDGLCGARNPAGESALHVRCRDWAGSGTDRYTAVKTGVANPPYVVVPVNLKARHVLGIGASYRY